MKIASIFFRKTQNTQHKQKKLVKTAKIFHIVKLATCFLVFFLASSHACMIENAESKKIIPNITGSIHRRGRKNASNATT